MRQLRSLCASVALLMLTATANAQPMPLEIPRDAQASPAFDAVRATDAYLFKTSSIFDATTANPEWMGEEPERLQRLMPA